MSRWIHWSQWTEEGMIGVGQMPITEVDRNLREFEKQAKKVLEETDADHVLYGVKLYDDEDHLEEVKFYMIAMDDERFETDVASKAGVVVYALHKRK